MAATATPPVNQVNKDYRILGVISVGHFMSHYYCLTLPPIFPQLREAFGVSYTELGTLLALMMAATAVVQIPMGFWVDRYGARIVLTVGLVMMSICCLATGLVSSFWPFAVFTLLSGFFNAVFHPADYAILNSSMAQHRMGRAFSIHTFSGHLGAATAPALMIAMTSLAGWKIALVASGVFGILVAGLLATQWNVMREDTAPKAKKADGSAGGWAATKVLITRPILIFFLFFALLSMTATGMQTFAVTAFVTLHATPLETANLVLSIYLFCSAGGILIGGELADRWPHHGLLAAIMFALTALFSVMMAVFNMPAALLAIMMAVMGLGQGITRPARDMMLRDAAPKGSIGRIFGFVSSGLAFGSAVAPIPFGLMLDWGLPAWVFYLNAIFMLIAIATVVVPKDITELRPAPAE